ncbi:MAG: family transposase, partial [Clostridiaceae bacterium]|nr:family transposase [Clostridiaceae bacterium]
MLKKKEYNQKHLSTSQRIHIEKGLNDGLTFAAIARKLDKHPSTIAKEVKKYRTFQPRNSSDEKTLRCALFKECTMRFLCDDKDCVKMCKSCYDVNLKASRCTILCPEYREPQCKSIQMAPYICNSCPKIKRCNKNKAF